MSLRLTAETEAMVARRKAEMNEVRILISVICSGLFVEKIEIPPG